MHCSNCEGENPTFASYCYRCGDSLRGAEGATPGRRTAYAVQSAEKVTQFALISTIMPATSRDTADNYRWSLIATSVLVVGFTLLGYLPAAILAGAALVPVTYLVYLYDVNVWEDAPLPTVLVLFGFTGVLAVVVSLVFFRGPFADELLSLLMNRGGIRGVSIPALVIFAVLLPIVAEVVKNLGGVWLASQPRYDDMIDGLTFGIAAGTAYAAFETIVAYWPVFTAQQIQTSEGLAGWLVVIVNLMVVKSLIYGTATGIAVAAYSGIGEGYEGFRPAYFANFGLAAGANILYWLGVRLFSYAPFGQALGLLWGLLIAGVLIIRMRVMIHTALLEAALRDAQGGRRSAAATTGGGHCPECGMPLVPDSLFCVVCGESVRATSSMGRHHVRDAFPQGEPS